MILEGGETVSVIQKIINSIWNKEELSDQWKRYFIVPVQREVIKQSVIIIVGYHCYQLHTKFYQISSHIDKIIGDHQCGFQKTYQLLIRFSVFTR
jgi:hypothetical protein